MWKRAWLPTSPHVAVQNPQTFLRLLLWDQHREVQTWLGRWMGWRMG